MIYCDTSFLFSLYAWDDNSPTANAAYRHDGRRPLLFTDWQRIELRNTLRLSCHRLKRQGNRVPFKPGNTFKRIEEDLANGILRRADVDWPGCLKLAEMLSAGHTEASGVVMLDLWHVAVAASLNADTFWTFDAVNIPLRPPVGVSTMCPTLKHSWPRHLRVVAINLPHQAFTPEK